MNKEKTLSQQICELCGLLTKTIPCPHKGCRNHATHPCEVCNNKRFIEVYPNFENPENFVRLLELKILTGCHLWGYLSLKGIYLSSRQSFLKTLLVYLGQNFSDAEAIKQSIRNYDGWVWG